MSAAIETEKLTKTYGKSRGIRYLRPASVFYYGSASKDGIDWGKFVGDTLVALLFVLLATLAFARRDVYT